MTCAIDTMRVSIRLGQASGFLMPQIWTNADLAALYGELGGVDRGIELASQSYTLAAERFPRGMSRVHGVLARLSLLRGDVRQAESHVEQGKANFVNDFAQRAFDRLLLIEIEYVRVFQSALEYLKGKALLARGDAESAREMLLHALTEAEKIGSRWMLRQIYAALGERERACELVNFIAVNTPENLRAAFLSLPQVRMILD